MTNTQKLGDDLYKKIENLLPGKTKRNQRNYLYIYVILITICILFSGKYYI